MDREDLGQFGAELPPRDRQLLAGTRCGRTSGGRSPSRSPRMNSHTRRGPLEEASQGSAVHLGYQGHASAGAARPPSLNLGVIGARGLPRRGREFAPGVLVHVEGRRLNPPSSQVSAQMEPALRRGRAKPGLRQTKALARRVTTALIASVLGAMASLVGRDRLFARQRSVLDGEHDARARAGAWWKRRLHVGVDVALIDSGVAPWFIRARSSTALTSLDSQNPRSPCVWPRHLHGRPGDTTDAVEGGRRRRRRVADDRGDPWVIRTRPRPRSQHPRDQPFVRHELSAGSGADPLAYAAETGKCWDRGRRSRRKLRLPETQHNAPTRDPAYDSSLLAVGTTNGG